jgi:hypothetical protein
LTVGLDDALAEIHRKGGRHDPFDVYTNPQVALIQARPPWADPKAPPASLAALATDAPTASPLRRPAPPKTTAAPERPATRPNEPPPTGTPRGEPTEAAW